MAIQTAVDVLLGGKPSRSQMPDRAMRGGNAVIVSLREICLHQHRGS